MTKNNAALWDTKNNGQDYNILHFFTGSLVVDLFSAIILDIVNGYVIMRGINMSQINP